MAHARPGEHLALARLPPPDLPCDSYDKYQL
jgi:hypothetical protein